MLMSSLGPRMGEFAARAKRSFHDILGGGAIPAAMANVAVLGTKRSPSSFRSRFLQRALKAFLRVFELKEGSRSRRTWFTPIPAVRSTSMTSSATPTA
ncbi:hypothetical protein D3C81_1839450 [compost metagenome]